MTSFGGGGGGGFHGLCDFLHSNVYTKVYGELISISGVCCCRAGL